MSQFHWRTSQVLNLLKQAVAHLGGRYNPELLINLTKHFHILEHYLKRI